MCGHLDQHLPYDLAVLAEVIDEIAGLPGWNPIVIPMHPVVVMTAEHGVTIGRWAWQTGKRVDVHARRESLPIKWRDSYRHRRCAIPCLGWWEATWHFNGNGVVWLPGIWRAEEIWGRGQMKSVGPAVQVITGPADPRWHLQSDRHPIPLSFNQAQQWCNTGQEGATLDQPLSSITVDGHTTTGVDQQSLFDLPDSGPD
jgi:putative SOS response-associated peptidase YedK